MADSYGKTEEKPRSLPGLVLAIAPYPLLCAACAMLFGVLAGTGNILPTRGIFSGTMLLILLVGIHLSLAVYSNRRLRAELLRSRRQLEIFRTTDPLTEIGNARSLADRLRQTLALHRRNGRPVCVVAINVDHFKHYSNTFGQIAGEQVLIQLAAILRANLRETDLAARLEGDEFVLVLPDTDSASGFTVAEHLRRTIEQYAFPFRQITISAGIASTDSSGGLISEVLTEMAELALQQSKDEGRNRTSIGRRSAPIENAEPLANAA